MEHQLLKHFKGKKASEVFQDYIEPYVQALLADRRAEGIHTVPSIPELETMTKIPYCILDCNYCGDR